jgi:hypothetical protein
MKHKGIKTITIEIQSVIIKMRKNIPMIIKKSQTIIKDRTKELKNKILKHPKITKSIKTRSKSQITSSKINRNHKNQSKTIKDLNKTKHSKESPLRLLKNLR